MRPNNNKFSSYSLYVKARYALPVHTGRTYGPYIRVSKCARIYGPYYGRIYGPYLRVVRIELQSNLNCSLVLSFVGSQGMARSFYLGVQNIPCIFTATRASNHGNRGVEIPTTLELSQRVFENLTGRSYRA